MALDLIAVIGPTACGKTRRAVEIANSFNGAILSSDSRQVYRGMTIGTGKDLDEYGDIEYHLIDICEAGEKYNLYCFLRDADLALQSIRKKEKMPVVCGGSGMYVESLLGGIRLPDVPENKSLREKLEQLPLERLTEILSGMKQLHNITDVDTVKRAVRAIEIEKYYLDHPDLADLTDKATAMRPESLIIGLDISREERRRKISERLDRRLSQGMVEEVQALLNSGISAENLIYYGLEYKYITLYIIGNLTYDEMHSKLEIAIHQFAKRQMTWFRGMERRGFKINWLPADMPTDEFVGAVGEMISIAEHSESH